MGGSEAGEEVGRETQILGAETWEVTRAQCNNVTLTHDTGGTRYPGPIQLISGAAIHNIHK